MMRVYIAGKVTGDPYPAVVRKFEAAERMLRDFGYEPVNPIKEVNDPHMPWHKAMRICIASMLRCDAVLCLPCSLLSKGAQMEREIAERCQITVCFRVEALLKRVPPTT